MKKIRVKNIVAEMLTIAVLVQKWVLISKNIIDGPIEIKRHINYIFQQKCSDDRDRFMKKMLGQEIGIHDMSSYSFQKPEYEKRKYRRLI